MSATENLSLPYILPAQAQKHVTHNEALQALDALVHLAVIDTTLVAPPASPQAGDRYIVPVDATDAWTDRAGDIAAWQEGAWSFYSPQAGWIACSGTSLDLLVFDGAGWRPATTDAVLPARLGINATADAPNRLALSGEASLFSHEGAGHQLKINKADTGDTASLLFQTGWSGRAEFGLAGDDNFHVKVSADGDAFTEALVIDRTTGKAAFPAGVSGMREQLLANRTYHVSPTGSNSNSGLSAGAPFATLQKAVDEAAKLDCSIYDVTIRLAGGNYAGATISRPLFGGGLLSIIGNTASPSTVIVNSPLAVSSARISVRGLKMQMLADWQNAFRVGVGGDLSIGLIDFGWCGANASHIHAQSGGLVTVEDDYIISAGAQRHINLIGLAQFTATNRTTTLSGVPAFTHFASVITNSCLSLWGHSFIGAATGGRYTVTTNGTVNTYGKPVDFLPGSAAGSLSSGGVYA